MALLPGDIFSSCILCQNCIYCIIIKGTESLGCTITPDILNLHFMIGIPTFMSGCQASLAEEDKCLSAVTHLACARTQNSGTGILGVTKY